MTHGVGFLLAAGYHFIEKAWAVEVGPVKLPVRKTQTPGPRSARSSQCKSAAAHDEGGAKLVEALPDWIRPFKSGVN